MSVFRQLLGGSDLRSAVTAWAADALGLELTAGADLSHVRDLQRLRAQVDRPWNVNCR